MFIFLAATIILIAIAVSIASSGPKPVQQPKRDIADYANTSATAVYTVVGQINAEELHRGIRISVNRNLRTVEVLSGYNNTVINSKGFPNTQAAYDEFLYALRGAGFTRTQETKTKEEKGTCPLGQRYIYQLQEFGDDVQRLWSTSCIRSDGPFGGSATLVKQLFQKQILDYDKFVRGVEL